MATLLERLDDLAIQFERLSRAHEEREVVDALRSRSQQVKEACAEVERAINALVLVERLGGKIARKPPASAALRAKPAAVAERLAKAPEFAQDNQWKQALLDPLSSFSEKTTTTALESWQALVDERVPPVKDDVFKQLERFQTESQIREVQSARGRVRQLRSSLPLSSGAWEEVIASGDVVKKVLTALEDLPRSVQNFLAKAVKNEATMDDFTVDVQQYLKDNQFLQFVRIGLKK